MKNIQIRSLSLY